MRILELVIQSALHLENRQPTHAPHVHRPNILPIKRQGTRAHGHGGLFRIWGWSGLEEIGRCLSHLGGRGGDCSQGEWGSGQRVAARRGQSLFERRCFRRAAASSCSWRDSENRPSRQPSRAEPQPSPRMGAGRHAPRPNPSGGGGGGWRVSCLCGRAGAPRGPSRPVAGARVLDPAAEGGARPPVRARFGQNLTAAGRTAVKIRPLGKRPNLWQRPNFRQSPNNPAPATPSPLQI
jgi:hypothetical protein